MNLDIEERERLAYINGDTKAANLFAGMADDPSGYLIPHSIERLFGMRE